MEFRSSRTTKLARDRLLDASGFAGPALDRLAIALSLARGQIEEGGERVWPSMEHESGSQHDSARIDDFDGRAVFHPILSTLEGRALSQAELCEKLRGHLNRGYDLLYQVFEEAGSDWESALRRLSPAAPGQAIRRSSGPIPGVTVRLGTRSQSGEAVEWTVNREAGTQTNANARLAGLPGVGKSQVLLHLLTSIARQGSSGFFVFDYKGDLASNSEFLEATGATVYTPGETPIPINPFQLPEATNRTLAPRAFAELFETLEPKLGSVQKRLVTQAMERAYARVPAGHGRNYPTLAEVAAAIEQVYSEADRPPDSVLAALADLTGYDLFSEVSERPLDELFSARWVIDLSSLRGLRDFVAFVLLEFLHQAARGIEDAAYDPEQSTRELRAVIAIDEAHYYMKRRCQPLLYLLRIGRSKGLPVFLSSQSLEDFRKQTELSEFLPNTFLFRHGGAMDRKTVAGALGLGSGESEAAAALIAGLDKFSVLTNVARSGPLAPIQLTGFWQFAQNPRPRL
jgi:hypothetical protein